jgi:hypothetical protein
VPYARSDLKICKIESTVSAGDDENVLLKIMS